VIHYQDSLFKVLVWNSAHNIRALESL